MSTTLEMQTDSNTFSFLSVFKTKKYVGNMLHNVYL